MVEQTRQPSRVASLQAGPGEVDTGTLIGINLRTTRAFGRQLALIGDQLDQELTRISTARFGAPRVSLHGSSELKHGQPG
uniref:Uncharacterized protein n=1 Tax=Echeneis naucrates TaxID=173247 RepID=A0A665W2U3_ECHNA